MKRWAVLTVGLYVLLLLLLTLPLCLLGGLQWDPQEHVLKWQFGASDVWELIRTGWYWAWLAVLVAAQALMLIVPVQAAGQRPRARRSVMVPTVVAAFLLANLFMAGVFAVLAAAFGDHMLDGFELPIAWLTALAARIPGLAGALGRAGITLNGDLVAILNLVGLMLFFWLLWGLVFYHYAKGDDAGTLVQRATRWLLRGSILELLVAVPSHIIVRSRTECCAPFASFWGIVTGLSVMLLSFGPGVLFLFARRIRGRSPRTALTTDKPGGGSGG